MISTQGISAITAHLKLIVVGTQMGYIWLMDHFGHVDHQNVPVIRPHRSAVTKLAIDGPGNYIMSCGNDGRVAISGVGCDELNHLDRRAEIHFTWHLNMFCSGVSYALGSPGKHAELVVFGLKMDNEADEDASCENTKFELPQKRKAIFWSTNEDKLNLQV
ncbi:hypothetical protein ANCCEY_14213 [Ancylostoma ceylanicum]|uniref:Vps41 beta-propeller domain-containing protein n=1 Tax=Ancylostoma ceylanicum TaxID=53326 RepID=A0A0D6L713_9BILA|nr:hypothetical protein ANCCEY_14213 [Ancylostoma ceylanicum]